MARLSLNPSLHRAWSQYGSRLLGGSSCVLRGRCEAPLDTAGANAAVDEMVAADSFRSRGTLEREPSHTGDSNFAPPSLE